MQWLPVGAFVLLGVIFCDKALRRGARRTWAWGRAGGGAPLSRKSYAVWALTFFAIAFAIARAPEPGVAAAVVLALCLVSIIVAGFADTRALRRQETESQQGSTDGDSKGRR
jgi:uncharacterized membrane protein YbaN (DUF454 family)